MKFTLPRGTKDYLYPKTFYLNYIKNVAITVLESYAYKEIITPIFEQTDLFVRGIGNLTDIVEKEMYTFLDKKGRSLTLRPEGTASVVRAYIENNLEREGLQRFFYQGPMFRYERPQAGRYRQFEQIGIEAIGSQSPVLDAEVIMLSLNICKKLGLQDLFVAINSVGCPVCRPVIREQIKAFVFSSLKNLCQDCQNRYNNNPLRIIDCKNEKCKTYFTAMPNLISVLCHECADHLSTVLGYLDSSKINYKLDPFLVRGLDYYTKTAFEIKSNSLGSQSAVCGGGRYDELVKELGGKKTPAIGFAFGLERMLMIIEQANLLPQLPDEKTFIYFASIGELAKRKAFVLKNLLIEQGIKSEIDIHSKSLKLQLRQAASLDCPFVCILGEEEIANNMCVFKKMANGVQEKINIDKIVDKVKKIYRKENFKDD